MSPWGRGCLLQGFEWENFGVLNWQSLMGGGRTCRFDCIYVSYILSRQILIGHSFLKPFEKIGDKKLSRGEGGCLPILSRLVRAVSHAFGDVKTSLRSRR